VNKFPIPENEAQRLDALESYQILNSLEEKDFDRITEMASLICDVPISLISLLDENRQWFKSIVGLSVTQTSRDLSFCQYAIMNDVIMEIEDATKDERFKENALVTSDPNIRFYAGCPLIDPNGFALGTLCVIDRVPKVLNANQKRALELLAQEVMALIVERRQKQELKNFEKLFELSKDLLFVGATDGFFKKINPAFQKVLGWDEQYMLTHSSFDFIHPEDLEKTSGILQQLEDGGVCVNFNQRFKTSDGAYKTLQWTSSTESETGNIFGIGRDITQAVLKDKELAENEEKLRIFFEHSEGLMCTHDLQGNFLSVNHAGASLLGYTKQEISKMSLFDIVPSERHGQLKAYLSNIKINGKSKGQMITRHKDGSLKIWLFNNVLETTSASDIYVIGNATDITEKHYLETTLARTKQLLEQTNTMARVGGWEMNMATQKIHWSAITRQILEVDDDYEPTLETVLDAYKEGESRDKLQAAVNSAITEGKPWDLELQVISSKGKELWVRALGHAEFESGKLTRLRGALQDINGSKQAEFALKQSIETQEALNKVLIEKIHLVIQQDQTIEKIKEFKFLADSIPQIIWTANPDGNLDYYNQHWFDYTDMTLEQTLGWGWGPVLHPDDLERCIKVWTESVNTGKPYEIEYRFKRAADGVYKWHLGRALPMRDEDGNIVKWFGSCTDIDEYKRALDLESKLSQYEDFNRIVAHNLRGPAGSIGMMLDMIAESEDEADKADLFEMLKESSRILNGTLDELMNVLEIRLSKKIEFNECDVSEIISGVSKMLNGQILSKKAIINTDLNVPIIHFPKIYLESIVYNMISNSLKYSNPDIPPVISITSSKAEGKTVLRFKDNGLGIDLKKHGANMFQLSKVFHKGYDSKGVGLFMTKTQIETFGGSITVESEPYVGTEFVITL
jgi:PAS domain S-box-containing protein